MDYNINIIKKKLERFLRKYYLSKFVRGLIISTIILVLSVLTVLIIEHFLFLNIKSKHLIISILIVFNSLNFLFFTLYPLIQSYGWLRTLSEKDVNEYIVKEFPEVKDRLINVIELKEQTDIDLYSSDLISKSIQQKIDDLKPFEFEKAVKIKDNIKYYLYFSILSILVAITALIKPEFYKESAHRLLNPNVEFEKPLPFEIKILNDSLKIGKNENFNLKLHVTSKKEIERFYISFWGNDYQLNEDSSKYYSYKFSNINNDISFLFKINEYTTNKYNIEVLRKPLLLKFNVNVIKPNYTNLENEEFQNVTDLRVPVGSIVKYTFNTRDTDSLMVVKNDIEENAGSNGKEFNLKWKVFENTKFSIKLKNNYFTLNDYFQGKIEVIGDEFPTIKVVNIIDSTDYTKSYFKGLIADDYGFSELNFVIKTANKTDSIIQLNYIKNNNEQDFYYAYDFSPYKGFKKRINYYFQVYDNDKINGPKSAVSETFTFIFPDEEDMYKFQDEKYEDLEDILNKSNDLTERLKNEMEEFKEKMINSSMSDWERKEAIKNIISEKNNLEDAIKELQNKNKEIDNYLNSFSDQNEEIIEKQKKIQELLNDVFSEELKELFEEFNKMMEEFNKDKFNELNKKMDISLDDLLKQMDRNLEILKRMKLEQQLNMISENLENIIEEQKEALEKFDETTNDEMKKKESEIAEKIEKLKDNYEQAKKQNEKLEEPMNLLDMGKEFEDIENEFEKTQDNLSKNKKKKSKESMSENKQNMENLAFMMKQMMESLFMEQRMENLSDLLQILDNLVLLSFSQEELLQPVLNTEFQSEQLRKQGKIENDFKVIEDSLYALAKREPSINTVVNKEIVSIKSNFENIRADFSENRVNRIKVNQQKVLTSVNNLALFMSEIIKQLQKQMSSSMPGNQNCNKPGNNPNPNSMGSMKSMQQSLQQQLEQIMQMMKEGGRTGKLNSELGKTLSQQEKMQQMLRQIMNQGNVGSGAYETLKSADELLSKIKEDIIRNNISQNTIERSKKILTRLLEAENAQTEREFEEKRRSKTAENQYQDIKNTIFEKEIKNYYFDENLQRNKLLIKPFYQKKIQQYNNSLDSIDVEVN
jgi:hypothetical protein